ncbi:ABC transporter ATP-binding protein/permease [Furfurilactobacillus cerevisiae]|uniref:ABC transporter ATP-binding protein/permease n=1 Tax=Furfurilactobacillus rossiae TaxID=231049 RepID=UPI003B97F4DD
MSYLQLSNIHKSYYLGKEEFPVLNGINLNFELGEFVSILGESGGGKSTLMNIIGGLDREFTGSVTVDGRKLDHSQEKKLDAYRRDTIGYIYQSYNLISHLTVLDNVQLSLDMTTLDKSQREKRALNLLDRVGLSEHAYKYPNQLSGGQKQRVAIARALASDPKVIIADEPTGALDAQNTEEVLEMLNSIAQEGRLVITVTHSQHVADAGTRIVRLADGKIVDNTEIKSPYTPKQSPSKLRSRLLPFSVSLRTAFKHFRFHLGRNSLIVLGTTIGLFAVMLFSGLGNGISGYISNQITKMTNPQVITVSRYAKMDPSAAPSPTAAMGNGSSPSMGASQTVKNFSKKQIDQLSALKHVSSVEKTYNLSNIKIDYQGKSTKVASMSNWTQSQSSSSITQGKQPKAGEVIIDKKAVAKKLSKPDPSKLIGKSITLNYQTMDRTGKLVNVKFKAKVSGIGKSSSGISSVNAVNTKTLTKAMKQANVNTDSSSLSLKINSLDSVKGVTQKINHVKSDGKRLYSATAITSIIDKVQTYVNLASLLLAIIAGISLLVSALMIIVTMYMSVSDRTKEIGILRALGESKRDIRRMFISESLIIGVLSASLATILALGIGAIANIFIKSIAAYAFVQISVTNVVSVFVIALIISLIAAWLPARHAAALNPIDALSAD